MGNKGRKKPLDITSPITDFKLELILPGPKLLLTSHKYDLQISGHLFAHMAISADS